MSESLSDRVRFLVKVGHPRGAKYAAEAIGIPNATLHKILEGQSENPRSRTLQAIADHFATSVRWLLSGDGPPPALLADERPAETTARVLSRLGLDATRRDTGPAYGAVMGLSVWPAVLERSLREGAPVAARGVSPRNAAAFFAHRRAAMQHFDECVAELLEALVIEAGEEGARRQLLARGVQEALTRVREPMPPPGAGVSKSTRSTGSGASPPKRRSSR